MHDYDQERSARALPRIPEKDPAARDTADARSVPAASPGMHDAASLMHLQRTIGNAGVVQLLTAEGGDETGERASPVHDVIGKGGGTPLDESTRSTMEGRFGQGFGDVRVHTDEAASASAESVGANAYTVGSEIVFKSGQFDTASPTGQRTLAHELTHVVQQRSGPVDGTDAPGGIKLSDPSDRFERAADQTASEIVSMSGGGGVPAADTAQRDLDDEDPAVQALVQRQVGPEEEDEETEVGP
jgi:hypothetical protein